MSMNLLVVTILSKTLIFEQIQKGGPYWIIFLTPPVSEIWEIGGFKKFWKHALNEHFSEKEKNGLHKIRVRPKAKSETGGVIITQPG